jgi:hypothetical protein
MISREQSSRIVSEVLLTAELADHQIPHISWRTGLVTDDLKQGADLLKDPSVALVTKTMCSLNRVIAVLCTVYEDLCHP